MGKIKNEGAYYATVVKNMDIQDFKSNDEFYEMFSSVGGEAELQQVEPAVDAEFYRAETELCDSSVENWLLMMESERLHTALKALPYADLEFIFELFSKDMTQRELALQLEVSQNAVSKRWKKISKKIKEAFK